MTFKRMSIWRFLGRRAVSITGVALAAVMLAALGLGTLAAAESEAVTVTKTATPNQVTRGSIVLYEVDFENTGAETVYLNEIRDTLPAGFTYTSMGAGSDIGVPDDPYANPIVWTGPFEVTAGATLYLKYNVVANAPASLTPYNNYVQATLSTGGTIFDQTGVIVLGPIVTGSKTVNYATAYDRTEIEYTVTIENEGTLDASLNSIVDTLPAYFRFRQMVSGPLGDPAISGGGNTLTWAGPIVLAPSEQITFKYRVLADGTGGQAYQNSVVATYGDLTAGPFEATVTLLAKKEYAYVPLAFRSWNSNPPPPPPVYRLAYESKLADNYEIYVINADGTGNYDVSNLAGGDARPDWSPDASKIAWVHFAGDAEIWVVNADGSNPQQLTTNDADDMDPQWSPDGTKIAFRSERDGRWEVYVMNADGSSQTRLTNESCQSTMPQWSPDGTKIAFLCGLDASARVWVMNANGTGKVNLTDDDDPGGAIAWSPDSAYVAYVRSPSGYDSEIFKVRVSDRTLTRLTTNDVDDYSPQWSPDGTKILFSHKFATFDVAVMNTDGTNIVNLTNSDGGDYVPKWSPDGTKIAFIATRDGNNEMYVMNADGSNPVRLTFTTSVHEERFDWMPFEY